MEIVTPDEIIKDADLEQVFDELQGSKRQSRFFEYIDGDWDIFVECTTTQMMESVTCLTVLQQANLFGAMGKRVPEPGDAIHIVGTRGDLRDAFVTRLKGGPKEVRLLITH